MMTKESFKESLEKLAAQIDEIRLSAHQLHQDVNQQYGEGLPYSYHLDMVVDIAGQADAPLFRLSLTYED